MNITELDLKKGNWLVANCGKYPSEKDCKLVFMAPEDQKEDLLNSIEEHAIEAHGHSKSENMREEIGKMLERVQI